ncbi:putative short-chain dehydrogenase [Geopyxis carbonaria]|nr:putative short-chain dehydrogenase [Geopyxis carbonaria]
MGSIGNVLRQPLQTLPLPPTGAFAGTTAIVTGGNTGIGFEACRHLLSRGVSRLIIASRNPNRGASAKEALAKDFKDAIIEVWSLDMDKYASCASFAEQVKSLDRLDYLFLNAGLAKQSFNSSSEGWEEGLQVNVLSTTLIALLVLPTLIAMGQSGKGFTPHVIITTSSLHMAAPLPERKNPQVLESLNDKANFESHKDPLEQYMATKLFNIYATKELAKLVPVVEGNPATIVSCTDPGLCKSELDREGRPFPLNVVIPLFARTTEVGARNLVANANLGKAAHQQYISSCKVAKPGSLVTSQEGQKLQTKIWEEILDILSAKYPEVAEYARRTA